MNVNYGIPVRMELPAMSVTQHSNNITLLILDVCSPLLGSGQ